MVPWLPAASKTCAMEIKMMHNHIQDCSPRLCSNDSSSKNLPDQATCEFDRELFEATTEADESATGAKLCDSDISKSVAGECSFDEQDNSNLKEWTHSHLTQRQILNLLPHCALDEFCNHEEVAPSDVKVMVVQACEEPANLRSFLFEVVRGQ
jgi:hypothetical protein